MVCSFVRKSDHSAGFSGGSQVAIMDAASMNVSADLVASSLPSAACIPDTAEGRPYCWTMAAT